MGYIHWQRVGNASGPLKGAPPHPSCSLSAAIFCPCVRTLGTLEEIVVDVEHARRQARELLKAAQAGEAQSLRALDGRRSSRLVDAQRAVARQAGCVSWTALVRRYERFRPVTYPDVDWRRVKRVTAVPFLPTGTDVMLVAEGHRLVLPAGAVLPDEDPLAESVLRLCLSRAGLRSQDVHVLALSDDGRHIVFWTEGARYNGKRPHRTDATWWTGPAADAVRLLEERGDNAIARLVAAAEDARVNLTEEQFWEDNQRILDRAYLKATTPQGGSGYSGSAEGWRAERSIICDAINRHGTFLDVGCANGHLMESVVVWCAERGLQIQGYGLDISPRLSDLARQRLPEAAERIWTANALHWVPPKGLRFDFVHTLLDLVPEPRRRQLIEHLLDAVVIPGGRLIVSQYWSADPAFAAAAVLEQMGFQVAGTTRLTQPPGGQHGRASAWLAKPTSREVRKDGWNGAGAGGPSPYLHKEGGRRPRSGIVAQPGWSGPGPIPRGRPRPVRLRDDQPRATDHGDGAGHGFRSGRGPGHGWA